MNKEEINEIRETIKEGMRQYKEIENDEGLEASIRRLKLLYSIDELEYIKCQLILGL